jgi:hypothetical protein
MSRRYEARYKDGTAMSRAEADMIMRAVGFTTAMDAEAKIAEGEAKRRARGQITPATMLGLAVRRAQDHADRRTKRTAA